MADAEFYKVTTVDSAGNAIVGYVAAEGKQTVVRAMREEYDNVVVEPISIEDLPEALRPKK